VDLCAPAEVERLLDEAAPTAGLLHCAAFTAVDRAEGEPELARRVNALAPENLARAAARRGIALVVLSTDFVFSGDATRPYREEAPTAPASVYGRTKLEGERLALAAHPDGTRIVRTQWLYGPRGKHFPGTILELAGVKSELRVVDDQRGSPTSTLEIAPALWDVLAGAAPGIWHAACEGVASWFDLARATLELAGVATRVLPCTSEEFPRPARRPAMSALDCTKLAGLRERRLKPWRSALADFLAAERGLVRAAERP
jgi:dTDP-4-dehydrorhamnose reductase